MANHRILIVSPPGSVAEATLESFRRLDCEVALVTRGEEGIAVASDMLPDFVLLADNLPDMEPLDICWRLRNTLPEESTPVFLLANVAMNGAHEGAADSAIGQFCLRMLRFLNNLGAEHATPEVIEYHGLEIDRRRHRAAIDKRELKLTPTEFRLLWTLAAQPGYVLDRSELTETCLGPRAAVHERTIDAHIKSIRHKLRDRADLIETVRGVGYRFHESAATPSV